MRSKLFNQARVDQSFTLNDVLLNEIDLAIFNIHFLTHFAISDFQDDSISFSAFDKKLDQTHTSPALISISVNTEHDLAAAYNTYLERIVSKIKETGDGDSVIVWQLVKEDIREVRGKYTTKFALLAFIDKGKNT